jgi:hypothetical protein
MKGISNTTLSGIAMLMVVAACLALLVMGKFTLQETLLAIGFLATAVAGAVGHFFAQDASAPIEVSRTTIQDTDAGKVVKVETELPPREVLERKVDKQ